MGNTWNIPGSSRETVSTPAFPRWSTNRRIESRNISSPPKQTKVGGQPGHVLVDGGHRLRAGTAPVQVGGGRDVPGQDVHGRVVGDRRLVEEQVQLRARTARTPAMGRWWVRVIEYIREAASPPPLESPPTKSRDGSTPPVRSASSTSDGVLQAGRERELGGQPEVGDEDLAPGLAAQPGDEQPVHPGRGPDVAAPVEVQHGAPDCAALGAVPDAGRHRPRCPRCGVTSERPDQRRQTAPAQVVEHHLDRAELVDGQ